MLIIFIPSFMKLSTEKSDMDLVYVFLLAHCHPDKTKTLAKEEHETLKV